MESCVPEGGPSTRATRTAFVISSRKLTSTMCGLAKEPFSLTGPCTKRLRHKSTQWRGIWEWRVPVVLLFGVLLSRSANDGISACEAAGQPSEVNGCVTPTSIYCTGASGPASPSGRR